MSKAESCDVKWILQNLEATNKKADKLDYLKNTLERCAIPDTTTTTTRKKRKMSGYNCFAKVSYKIEKKTAEQKNRKPISFKEMLKAKTWSTFDNKQKSIWKHHANDGCPPRLWGG